MKRRQSILLIGADGQVGWELQRSLAPLGEVVCASLDGARGPAVDLADPRSLSRVVQQTAPDAVVNAAAYTAVDRAEGEPELAHKINADAPGMIGALLRDRGVPIVHYSTDFVFAGDADRPYVETDRPGPLNVYGETKLAGEVSLMKSGAHAIIFRTSWVYGARGHNFLVTMRRLLREKDELKVVDDQVGAPTWSRMLAEVTALVLYRVLAGDLDLAHCKGLYHLTGAGQTSWFGFARAIQTAIGARCDLRPIGSAEYRSPAVRPAYSVLDNTKLRETFGIALPDWETSLRLCLEELSGTDNGYG
jgi:dTDP-4-dehydrorhamnose reductase